MKLSEALVLRADIQKRIERLRERLALSVIVQEGEQPPENPAELMTELDALIGQLETLIRQINRTNITATLVTGVTITDALARRDTLRRLRVRTFPPRIESSTPGSDSCASIRAATSKTMGQVIYAGPCLATYAARTNHCEATFNPASASMSRFG